MLTPDSLFKQIHRSAGCMPDHRTRVIELAPWFQNWSVFSEIAGEYMGEEIEWDYPRDLALLIHEVPVYRVNVLAEVPPDRSMPVVVKTEWRYSTPEWCHHGYGAQLWAINAAVPQRLYHAALGQPTTDYPDGSFFPEMIAAQIEDRHWPRIEELPAP